MVGGSGSCSSGPSSVPDILRSGKRPTGRGTDARARARPASPTAKSTTPKPPIVASQSRFGPGDATRRRKDTATVVSGASRRCSREPTGAGVDTDSAWERSAFRRVEARFTTGAECRALPPRATLPPWSASDAGTCTGTVTGAARGRGRSRPAPRARGAGCGGLAAGRETATGGVAGAATGSGGSAGCG